MVVQSEGEPLILSVDTATETRSVAVVEGTRTLALTATEIRSANASSVLADIDAALKAAERALRDVNLLAVTTGPGSFTGLRAGLATMKALSVTLDKPLVGVQTLHAIACAARPSPKLLALLRAGRGEVFAQLLSIDKEGEVAELDRAVHVSPAILIERAASLRLSLKWAGNGAHSHAQQIEAAAQSAGLTFAAEEGAEHESTDDAWVLARPEETLAPYVASLALARFSKGETDDATRLRAVYVRASDAELNEQCRAHSLFMNQDKANSPSPA